MKGSLVSAAMVLIVAPVFASPELVPVRGTRYATYNVATRELDATGGPVRHGDVIWA